MNKIFPFDVIPSDDGGFRSFLKRHDPVAPFDSGFLSALEADIFERIDDTYLGSYGTRKKIFAKKAYAKSAYACFSQKRILGLPRNPSMPKIFPLPHIGMFEGWTARAAAFIAMLVVALGFAAGQAFYGAASAPPYAGNLSLVAFADEAPVNPSTQTPWGENDDYAE